MAGLTGHPAIDRYLEMVEETESPRIYHIWSFLSGISACLGRRVWLPFGEFKVWPNQYILLVGPPAVRKSTGINICTRLIKKATKVRFAPDDTSGQRQGLIKHLKGEDFSTDEEKEIENAMAQAVDIAGLENALAQVQLDTRDAHVTYIAASEFNSFIGQNAIDLITFLAKMWDGEDYQYQLKNSQDVLRDPLVNMIGGTTPTNISTALPAEAIGQGFMSRVILVYSNEKHKSIPRPRKFDDKLKAEMEDVFRYAFSEVNGPMQETPEAAELLDSFYEFQPDIKDPRFTYYAGRRHTHLQKVAMAMAVARRSRTIDVVDIQTAHTLLAYTEQFMPEALGEFGMSPLGAAKQKLVEYLQIAKVPVPTAGLWALMHRDMKAIDFQHTLAELTNAGRLKRVQAGDGQWLYMYNSSGDEKKRDKKGGALGVAFALLQEDAPIKRSNAAE